MEVTHLDHTNTHAIIGGMAPESFGVEANAEFFEMLSSTMYPNKKLAVVREVLCNSWDAHLMVNKQDTFVEVTIDDKEMAFKDFGPGIERSQIIKLYCTYGSSTKSHDGKQTGGFGLGSKAPFAYSKHFTVVSCHKGLRTIYAASRGSSETQGRPDFRPMVADIPTEETGITVTIPIQSREDRKSFEELVHDLAYLGGMKVKLNGKELPSLDLSKAEFPFVAVNHRNIGRHHGHDSGLYVRYGAVVYPISGNEVEVDAAIEAAVMLKTLANHYAVVLLAEPDTVGIAPSRETLSYSPKTVKTVVDLIERSEKCIVGNMPSVIGLAERTINQTLRKSSESIYSRFRELVESSNIFEYIGSKLHSRSYSHLANTKTAMTAKEICHAVVMISLGSDNSKRLQRVLGEPTDEHVRGQLKALVRKEAPSWKRYFNQMEFGVHKKSSRSYSNEKRVGRISLEHDLYQRLVRFEKLAFDPFKVRFAYGRFAYDGFNEDSSMGMFAARLKSAVLEYKVNPKQAFKVVHAIYAPSRAAAIRYKKSIGHDKLREYPSIIIITRSSSDIEGSKALMKKLGFDIHDASAHVLKREKIEPSEQLYLLGDVDRSRRIPKSANPVSDRIYDPATSTAKFFCYGRVDEVREGVFWSSAQCSEAVHNWAKKNLGDVVVIQNAADARALTKAGLSGVYEEIARRIVALGEDEAGAASLLHGTCIASDEMANIKGYFSGHDKSYDYLEAILEPLGCSMNARHSATAEQKELLVVVESHLRSHGINGSGKFGSQHIVTALKTARNAVLKRFERAVTVLGSKEFESFHSTFNSYYAHRMNSAILVSVLSAAAQAAAVQIALAPKDTKSTETI